VRRCHCTSISQSMLRGSSQPESLLSPAGSLDVYRDPLPRGELGPAAASTPAPKGRAHQAPPLCGAQIPAGWRGGAFPAHRKSIVHRWVKPLNIFIARDAQQGEHRESLARPAERDGHDLSRRSREGLRPPTQHLLLHFVRRAYGLVQIKFSLLRSREVFSFDALL